MDEYEQQAAVQRSADMLGRIDQLNERRARALHEAEERGEAPWQQPDPPKTVPAPQPPRDGRNWDAERAWVNRLIDTRMEEVWCRAIADVEGEIHREEEAKRKGQVDKLRAEVEALRNDRRAEWRADVQQLRNEVRSGREDNLPRALDRLGAMLDRLAKLDRDDSELRRRDDDDRVGSVH